MRVILQTSINMISRNGRFLKKIEHLISRSNHYLVPGGTAWRDPWTEEYPQSEGASKGCNSVEISRVGPPQPGPPMNTFRSP